MLNLNPSKSFNKRLSFILFTMNNQGKFLVYKSSAGSGKTYTLVKEYLTIALSGDTLIDIKTF